MSPRRMSETHLPVEVRNVIVRPFATTTPEKVRSTFAWTDGVRSPISSRKSVPPAATSKRPLETIGADERSSLMSEELGLRQRFGQCGAVDRHERPVGTSAGVVDGASDQLLPGPAFAREQDRCLLPGDQPRTALPSAHGDAVTLA